jgi:hypothetical protein
MTMAHHSALELVQSLYQAFGRGDLPGILELLADDAEWTFVGSRGLPYTGAVRGRQAIAGWFQSIPTVDQIQAFEPRQLLAGPDHVTAIGFEKTAALPGGKVFESEWVHVWRVKDGRVTSFWGMYDTEASARARAGA